MQFESWALSRPPVPKQFRQIKLRNRTPRRTPFLQPDGRLFPERFPLLLDHPASSASHPPSTFRNPGKRLDCAGCTRSSFLRSNGKFSFGVSLLGNTRPWPESFSARRRICRRDGYRAQGSIPIMSDCYLPTVASIHRDVVRQIKWLVVAQLTGFEMVGAFE
jgi:hypothetical protein